MQHILNYAFSCQHFFSTKRYPGNDLDKSLPLVNVILTAIVEEALYLKKKKKKKNKSGKISGKFSANEIKINCTFKSNTIMLKMHKNLPEIFIGFAQILLYNFCPNYSAYNP